MDDANVTDIDMLYVSGRGFYRPLMVGLTLINGAAAKGAGIHSFFTCACFLWH